MMRKRFGIQDVAREAGVSVTTTSYVLNKKENTRISEETAARVRAVAKKLGYVPSLSARTMVNRHSSLIGIIIPQIGPGRQFMFSNPFYGDFLSAAEYTVRESGYHLLISGTGANQDYATVIKTRQLDGVILVGAYPSDYLQNMKQTGIPIALVDSYIEDHYFHKIGINDRYSGYLGTHYLIDKGHRRIALVCGDAPSGGVMEQRLLGYQDALAEAGIPFRPEMVYAGNVDYSFGEAAAAQIIARGNGETAAFVTSDITALGVLNGMTLLGKRVPDDLSVVGFDDVSLARMCVPKLTTLHQNIEEKGSLAAQVIIDAIAGGDKRDIILPVHIVERGSVRLL
jgi:LacI family transcriptional regulator